MLLSAPPADVHSFSVNMAVSSRYNAGGANVFFSMCRLCVRLFIYLFEANTNLLGFGFGPSRTISRSLATLLSPFITQFLRSVIHPCANESTPEGRFCLFLVFARYLCE